MPAREELLSLLVVVLASNPETILGDIFRINAYMLLNRGKWSLIIGQVLHLLKQSHFFFNDYMFSIMNEVGSLPPPVAMFTDVCFVYKVQEL